MARTLALLLLALASGAAVAQPGIRPPVDPADFRMATPLETVASSWSEAFESLDALTEALDMVPTIPADEQADARTRIALAASVTAGSLLVATRFSTAAAGTEAPREANVAVFETGFGVAYHAGRVALIAMTGSDDGAEPDWHALAATLREATAQTRAALAALGVTPR